MAKKVAKKVVIQVSSDNGQIIREWSGYVEYVDINTRLKDGVLMEIHIKEADNADA